MELKEKGRKGKDKRARGKGNMVDGPKRLRPLTLPPIPCRCRVIFATEEKLEKKTSCGRIDDAPAGLLSILRGSSLRYESHYKFESYGQSKSDWIRTVRRHFVGGR